MQNVQITAAELMLHGKEPPAPKETRPAVCTRCLELDEELSTLRTELLAFTTLRTEYAALSARLELVEKEKNTLNRLCIPPA